jgi:outer membrane protein assembly factor BamB
MADRVGDVEEGVFGETGYKLNIAVGTEKWKYDASAGKWYKNGVETAKPTFDSAVAGMNGNIIVSIEQSVDSTDPDPYVAKAIIASGSKIKSADPIGTASLRITRGQGTIAPKDTVTARIAGGRNATLTTEMGLQVNKLFCLLVREWPKIDRC